MTIDIRDERGEAYTSDGTLYEYDRVYRWVNEYNKLHLPKENKYCIATGKKNIVEGTIFDDISPFINGCSLVKKLVTNQDDYNNTPGIVKFNLLTENCRLILDEWADNIMRDINSRHVDTVIRKNGKYNYLTNDLKLIDNDWFDGIELNYTAKWKVYKNGKINFIDINGKMVSDIWFVSEHYITDTGFSLLEDEKGHKYMMNLIGKILHNGRMLL